MDVRQPNTPGIVGYGLGIAISLWVCAPLVLLMLNAGADGGALLAALLYLPIALIEVGIYGMPVALVGVLVLDLSCRWIPSQAVHVAVAGLAGFALSLAWAELTDLSSLGPPARLICVLAGVSAAVGRAAVTPLVSSRRRLAAQGRLSGTARW